MSSRPVNRDEEIALVFARVLETIGTALTSLYGVPREDATKIEQGLLEWFRRYARRPGSARPAQSLRSDLIVMACRTGHVYSTAQLGEPTPAIEVRERSLALGPEVIAKEILESLRKGDEERGL
ncbi:MAG: hypothetical protein ACRD1P_07070 [Thermoanaerobaculia bacterium]